jgi:hypothetical protein
MDWSIVIGAVVVGVILIAAWAVVQYLPVAREKKGVPWDMLQYAGYAVKAARTATGATDNVELGMRAAEYIKLKFPKAPDVDIEVAIAAALDELENKGPAAPPATPLPDPMSGADLFG